MTQQQNIPKLRFPEFQGMPEWEDKRLGDCFLERLERNSEGRLLSVTIKDGVVLTSTLDRKNNSSTNKSNYKKVEKEDIAYNTMRMWQGASGCSGFSGIVSPAYTVLMPREKTYPYFFAFMFKCQKLLDYFENNSQGLTSDTWNLKYSALKKIKIYAPSFPEQQKIADCLTSLDERINAENDKLTQLKEHKKGLMQKLFPSEGQDRPTYRFPEFQNAAAWEEKRLGEVGTFKGGGTPSKEKSNYWNGNIPWISSSDIDEEDIKKITISRYITNIAINNSATKIIPKGSLLIISRVSVGKLAIASMDICTSQDFTNLIANNNCNFTYIAYYLKNKEYKLISLTQGTGIKGFTKDDISSMPIFIPNLPEQQKIADCLSALDDLITAQSEKIELLKAHKKGLMQQLFV